MGPEDVVLFVSYSGATRDMMETLRTAKSAGAKVILLTHYEDSPGAALADVVLLCGAQESPLDSGASPSKWPSSTLPRCSSSAISSATPRLRPSRRTAPAKR